MNLLPKTSFHACLGGPARRARLADANPGARQYCNAGTDVDRLAAIYLGAAANAGYPGMGLTKAMFSILTQTAVYAVILSLIAALAQSA
ncbi:MAG: hypothetical protein MO846_12015 [Candidatus Devosia symbiotica]|nr:hypothetical protein [Candidatus Devosia symbiotica]